MTTPPDSFTCPHCGESHAGLPRDIGYQLPDEIWAMPTAEREKRAKFDSDLCSCEGRFFIRGLLQLPFQHEPDYFGWGAWVEVERLVFQRYLEVYDKEAADEPAHAGALANQLPSYGRVIGTPVEIQFGTSRQRPTIRCPSTANSQLAIEQRQGIDSARHHEILAIYEAEKAARRNTD